MYMYMVLLKFKNSRDFNPVYNLFNSEEEAKDYCNRLDNYECKICKLEVVGYK